MLIAHPLAPPKRGEALCLPGGALTKWCPLPPLLIHPPAHLPKAAKRSLAGGAHVRQRYLPLPLPGAYPSVPTKYRKAPYLQAAPTQGGALCRHPRLAPNQRSPQMQRSALSAWRRPHEVTSYAAAPV